MVDQLVIDPDGPAATSGTAIDDDNAIERGAEATGNAVKRGAEAAADAARSTGRAVRDAVTDDDRDSDNDGK